MVTGNRSATNALLSTHRKILRANRVEIGFAITANTTFRQHPVHPGREFWVGNRLKPPLQLPGR